MSLTVCGFLGCGAPAVLCVDHGGHDACAMAEQEARDAYALVVVRLTAVTIERDGLRATLDAVRAIIGSRSDGVSHRIQQALKRLA